jgi:hypothetical protein
MGNEIADYLAKKRTTISQTPACKLTFHSTKLSLRKSTQADLSEYYAIQNLHISRDKTIKNRNIISDFPREDTVVTFYLITGHDCLVANYTDCRFIHPQRVLCKTP